MDAEYPKEYLHTVADLYPSLSEEQVKDAAENLIRFTELILQIYERIKVDPQAYAQFRALTGR